MSANAAVTPPGGRQPEPSMEEILASIRRIIADDSIGTKKDEAAPMVAPIVKPVKEAPPVEDNLDDDVLDLAQVATVAAAPAMVDVDPEPEDDFDFDPEPEPVAVNVLASPLSPMPASPPIQSVAALEDRILSDNTGSLVSQAFQSLSRTTTMPPAGRSLEDVISEMLRPMLRGWLDEHLPGIVERLVKAEIERVARGN